MAEAVRSSRLVRFGTFEVDLPAGELRKSGVKLKLTGQPFQVLTILLERPGEVVTREELQKRLWPDTFVDVDHNLNTAINKIREVLGDSAESPRFVETLPRRGYRFVAPVEGGQSSDVPGGSGVRQDSRMPWVRPHLDPVRRPRVARRGGLFHLQAAANLLHRRRSELSLASPLTMACRSAPRGHRTDASSPTVPTVGASSTSGCNRSVAAIRCRSPKDPVTTGSRTGRPTASTLRIVPKTARAACSSCPRLAVQGLERRIAPFGYYPRWSPDSSQILFQTARTSGLNRIYVADLDGSAPREILAEFVSREPRALHRLLYATWHPDGKRIISLGRWESIA